MDEKIAEKLKQPPENLSTRSQSGMELTYVQGWWDIDELNEIFGWDGWSYSTADGPKELFAQWHKVQKWDDKTKAYKEVDRFDVVCRAAVMLEVYTDISDWTITREDVGYGNGMTYKHGQEIDAYEGAGKEAVTDALKRAARTLGNRFGNCLYDKEFLKTLKNPPAKKPIAQSTQPPSPELATDLSPDTLHGYLKDKVTYIDLKDEYQAKILKGKGSAKDLPGFHAWCEKQVQRNLRSVPAWTPEVINTCRMALKGTGVV